MRAMLRGSRARTVSPTSPARIGEGYGSAVNALESASTRGTSRRAPGLAPGFHEPGAECSRPRPGSQPLGKRPEPSRRP